MAHYMAHYSVHASRRRILIENRDKQDDIRSWCQLVQQYDTDGNRNVRIKRLESVINTVFHRWIQDYEDVFTDLALPGQKTWNDDDIKKRRFVQNAQNIDLVDTGFEELVIGKSFVETCDFLRSHFIRLDQQYKEKAARQIYNASQLSNRDKRNKVKMVIALINEIQIQYSYSSYVESVAVPPIKTAMVCKLAQIPPEI
jgi:hypothetical protein